MEIIRLIVRMEKQGVIGGAMINSFKTTVFPTNMFLLALFLARSGLWLRHETLTLARDADRFFMHQEGDKAGTERDITANI